MAFGSLIGLVGGGIAAFKIHLNGLDTKAESAFNTWAKSNDISFTFTPKPTESLYKNPLTVYDKYMDEMSGNGDKGNFRNMFNHFNSKTLKKDPNDKNENARYDYEEFGARAAAIATSVANNDWHEWHKKQITALSKASPIERGDILQQIKKRQQSAYQYVTSTFIDHSLAPIRGLKRGESILLPTPLGERNLISVDPEDYPAKAIPNTLEYGDQMYKRVGETLKLAKQLMDLQNPLYSAEGRAEAMFQIFDQQTGLDYQHIYDKLMPSQDEKGNFVFKIKDGEDPNDVRTYILKTTEKLAELHGQDAVKEWWKIAPIINSVLSNNVGTGNTDINVEREGDPFASVGGRGDGGIGGSKSTLRHITVNIDKLMSVDSMNVNTDEDIDTFKEKLKKALIDVIKDVEISY